MTTLNPAGDTRVSEWRTGEGLCEGPETLTP